MRFCRVYIFLLVFLPFFLQAERVVISGHISDKVTKAPISSVNIYLKGTNFGTQSSSSGDFVLVGESDSFQLVFTCVGYKMSNVELGIPRINNLMIELMPEETVITDLFVVPGTNPALDILKKVRRNRMVNDIWTHEGTTYKISEDKNLRIVDQKDTLPVFYSSGQYFQKVNGAKSQISLTSNAVPPNLLQIYEKLMGEMPVNSNFYDSYLQWMGKNFVSPLGSAGGLFYNFYLIDSVKIENRNTYLIRFKSKNQRNLAFNGNCEIDAETYAIRQVNALLPTKANINFVKGLQIKTSYQLTTDSIWLPADEYLKVNLNAAWFPDTLQKNNEIVYEVSKSVESDGAEISSPIPYVQNRIKLEDLNKQLNVLNSKKEMRAARWIADVVLTGNMNLGKLDLGRVQYLARLSEIEGFKLNLPLHTNENLWNNASIGGNIGYGTLNRKLSYGGFGAFKLPFRNKTILKASYDYNYKRIDFNTYNFFERENPLASGDEDINSVLGLSPSKRLNLQQTFSVSLSHDWSSGFESTLLLFNEKSFANNVLPMTLNGEQIPYTQKKSVMLVNRISFGEKKYEDHLERIYIRNWNPEIYLITETGKYQAGQKSGNFSRLNLSIRQQMQLDWGFWSYLTEAGLIFGDVPYNMLYVPPGNTGMAFTKFRFGLMSPMEFAVDKFVLTHQELTLNGLLFNQIPLINKLNFREFFSFKAFYGARSQNHSQTLELPYFKGFLNKPYAEVGVGISNILGVLTLQSVWRLTESAIPANPRWMLMGALRIGF